MVNENAIGVILEGTVYAKEGDLPLSNFLDAFIEFVEANGWYFGGGAVQIDSKGSEIDELNEK